MTDKVEIHGLCEPRFEAVKDAFNRNFEEGMEVGASFAVTINGTWKYSHPVVNNKHII